MHVFRITLKYQNKDGGFAYVDLQANPNASFAIWAQSVRSSGGVMNESVNIPYENILHMSRLDTPEVDIGPVMGSA